MALPKLASISLICLISTNGCYRGVSFKPNEVAELRIAQQSAHILYRNGDTRRIDSFEVLTVRDRSPDDPAGTHEFGADVGGELQGSALRLTDGRGQRTFALQDVHQVEFEDYAPGRPWIIAGAAVAGAVLGGLVGAASMKCPDDPEAGLCGLGTLFAMSGGMAIGTGLGIGVSVPLTYPLGTRTTPRPPGESQD